MTEAQKYEGALFKEKSKRKSVTISEPPRITRQPYVEDAPEAGDGAVALVSAPPHAPSPPPSAPPSQPAQAVNVFDFLVNDETPNASRVALTASKEPMRMVEHAPRLFKSATPSPQEKDVENFRERGYSTGAEPVLPRNTESYRTPAPKAVPYQVSKDATSTDKKRKRQVEELDLTQARRPSQELDEEMEVDGDELSAPAILHSGLTGGLNKLLSSSKFPPSPDYSGSSGADIITVSPVKRTRASGSVASGTSAGAAMVGTGGFKVERMRGRNTNRGQLVRVRKVRRTSDESRPRKHHRTHRSGREHEEATERPRRPVKAIEYHPHHRSQSPGAAATNSQMVVYRSRAEMFLSFVTKGPESGSGCSINKALKRYHRERGDHGADKTEEEKELWKSLRLKRNERGEVVLLLGDADQRMSAPLCAN